MTLPMTATTGYARRLLAAAMLMALAACTTTDMASVEEPPPPPMTGQTNDPAPGFENTRRAAKRNSSSMSAVASFHPGFGNAKFRRQGHSRQPGRLAEPKSALAGQAAGFRRQFRRRAAQARCRKSAPTRRWPTLPRKASTRAACGPRVTARTARCATAPSGHARCRTAASSPICAMSATRRERRLLKRYWLSVSITGRR